LVNDELEGALDTSERLADDPVVSKSEFESSSSKESTDKESEMVRWYIGSPNANFRHCLSSITLGVRGSSVAICFGVGIILGDAGDSMGLDQASAGVPRIKAVTSR
jgi:hypothetical protein